MFAKILFIAVFLGLSSAVVNEFDVDGGSKFDKTKILNCFVFYGSL